MSIFRRLSGLGLILSLFGGRFKWVKWIVVVFVAVSFIGKSGFWADSEMGQTVHNVKSSVSQLIADSPLADLPFAEWISSETGGSSGPSSSAFSRSSSASTFPNNTKVDVIKNPFY